MKFEEGLVELHERSPAAAKWCDELTILYTSAMFPSYSIPTLALLMLLLLLSLD